MTIRELNNRRLKQYLECEEKILCNQSYTIGDRTYQRADLDIVRKMIASLLEAGATLDEDDDSFRLGRRKRVTFID